MNESAESIHQPIDPRKIYFQRLKTEQEKFCEKVHKTESCWLWTGAINSSGYGSFWFRGKIANASHASWVMHKGEIPAGMSVCHKCDNPPCVNPEHLFIGTHGDNMRDMFSKGRRRIAVGEAANSKLTSEDVREIRKLYFEYSISQQKIAAIFGVCQTNISRIIRRKAWYHIN